MTTANTFPAPVGMTVSFTNVGAGVTTNNFVLEPGRYTISLEMSDAGYPGDQVQMQNVVAGVSTAVETMPRSGYYDYVVPPGPLQTFNFVTVNPIKNVRITKMVVSVGPS